MTIERIDPKAIQQSKKPKFKAMGSGADFNVMLDTVSAGVMGPAGAAMQQYGGTNANAVLTAAFSGISQANAASGGMGGMGGGVYGTSYGSTPSFAGGYSAGMSTGYKGSSLGSLNSTSSIAGTEGVNQMDMINTMNSNNLELLELQAVMQSNMQSWNTKSNILSADHRARMAMIEKFTAR